MPTALQIAVQTAQTEFNNATTAKIAAKAAHDSHWFAYMKFCNNVGYNNSSSDYYQYSNIDRTSCGAANANNNPGCASKTTCENRTDMHNGLLATYNLASSTEAAKLVALQNAQALALNDPETIAAENDAALEAASIKRRNLIVTIVVIAAVIVVGYIVLVRYKVVPAISFG